MYRLYACHRRFEDATPANVYTLRYIERYITCKHYMNMKVAVSARMTTDFALS